MVSEVHDHVSSISQWHPGTSVRTEFHGPNTVVEKPLFLPKELRPKIGETGQEKGVFSLDYIKGSWGLKKSNSLAQYCPVLCEIII